MFVAGVAPHQPTQPMHTAVMPVKSPQSGEMLLKLLLLLLLNIIIIEIIISGTRHPKPNLQLNWPQLATRAG